ncbi:MAG: CPBP family intramembrane glutamic endopeptidase [Planctomycetota bacterium]
MSPARTDSDDAFEDDELSLEGLDDEDDLEDEDGEWGPDDDGAFEDDEASEDDWDTEVEAEYEDDELDEYAPREVAQTLSLGLVSMAPLVLAYEVTLALDGAGGARSVAEAILSLPLRPLSPDATPIVRRAGLVVVLVLALVVSARRTEALARRVGGVVLEGAVFALLLGPLLAFTAASVEPLVGPLVGGTGPGAAQAHTDFARIATAAGGAAYEEVLFRVLLLSLAFVVARWLLGRWVEGERAATALAVLAGSTLSAVAFAALHVDRCVAWLGAGGEPFDPAAFAWRTAAGLAFAGIVLWRGVGVAAWAHALFNLARILGWS